MPTYITVQVISPSKNDTSNDGPLSDGTFYRKVIDKLLYLSVTRPYICFAIQKLSQFMHDPKQYHLDVAFRIVHYVNEQLGLCLFLSASSSLGLTNIYGVVGFRLDLSPPHHLVNLTTLEGLNS